MATVIRRTNPDRLIGRGGVSWRCVRCGSKFDQFEEGKACAEWDFAKADRLVAKARRAARKAAREAAA